MLLARAVPYGTALFFTSPSFCGLELTAISLHRYYLLAFRVDPHAAVKDQNCNEAEI